MAYMQLGDLRISYRRAGAGPALLLLHGAVCDGRVWRRVLDSFAHEYTVVAWDAPGCGQSTDVPDEFRMPDYAERLAEFVDVLDLGSPHVVGHSWGSTLALQLCLVHSHLVRSLVLVGGYAGWAGSLASDEVDHRLDMALGVADSIEAGQWDPRSFPGLFSAAMPAENATELAVIMRDIRPAATRTMARALAEADLSEQLGAISVPTLVVAGDSDDRSALTIARDLVGAIPGATLTVLPGLGHECYLEDPAVFDTAVRAFLTAV